MQENKITMKIMQLKIGPEEINPLCILSPSNGVVSGSSYFGAILIMIIPTMIISIAVSHSGIPTKRKM